LLIFTLMVLPFIIWRIQNPSSSSAFD